MLTPSINDSLPSDLIFVAFKWLDGNQVFRIRLVCKQWLVIIDEKRAFGEVLVLEREEDLEWNESVLELFDGKSGSTLKKVSLEFKRVRSSFTFDQIPTTLLRSNESFLSGGWLE